VKNCGASSSEGNSEQFITSFVDAYAKYDAIMVFYNR